MRAASLHRVVHPSAKGPGARLLLLAAERDATFAVEAEKSSGHGIYISCGWRFSWPPYEARRGYEVEQRSHFADGFVDLHRRRENDHAVRPGHHQRRQQTTASLSSRLSVTVSRPGVRRGGVALVPQTGDLKTIPRQVLQVPIPEGAPHPIALHPKKRSSPQSFFFFAPSRSATRATSHCVTATRGETRLENSGRRHRRAEEKKKSTACIEPIRLRLSNSRAGSIWHRLSWLRPVRPQPLRAVLEELQSGAPAVPAQRCTHCTSQFPLPISSEAHLAQT